jgi:spermidine synthase
MLLEADWFTEASDEQGLGFSLKVKEKLHDERSDFQRIEIYATETFGHLMVIDGFVMLTQRDNFLYHEMMTHPALLSHGQVRDVAIIGGGDCGSLREVCRHPGVQSATQIEIDERVTRLAEDYFPELCSANDDPRATLLFDDGIAWMKNRADASLDLIIVDSTDPIGPAEGLFNKAFYQQCFRALRAGGLLVQQSESPLLHGKLIGDMHAAMQSAGFPVTRLLCFPQPVYPSGWWSATLAQRSGGPLAVPEECPLDTLYYTPAIHAGALNVPPFLQKALDQAGAR